jgi:thiopurine S-methyltransferase
MSIDAQFWHEKWEQKDIAFHQSKAHPLMVEHFGVLGLAPGSRVFVPLCGKTLDIAWLLGQGFHVAGAELSKIAIEELFADLGVKPTTSKVGKLEKYSADKIDIFVGDIFDLTAAILGPVDAVYDRAALVAFPEELRGRYAAHMVEITNKVPQFLISFEYDQKLLQPPPFSVNPAEVKRHYEGAYSLKLLADESVRGGLKGKCPAQEQVWLLR